VVSQTRENHANTRHNFHKVFVKRLQDEFYQYWEQKCKSTGSNVTKLLHSLKFNNGYTINSYLQKIKDFHIRKIFINLRIGTHCLNECTGRYTNTIYKNRICQLCKNGEVENVQHLLLKCSHFETLRKMYFEKVGKIHANYLHMPNLNKLKFLLNLETSNNECLSMICAYIENIYASRQQAL